jgi:outer membrane protein assembly factor BamB
MDKMTNRGGFNFRRPAQYPHLTRLGCEGTVHFKGDAVSFCGQEETAGMKEKMSTKAKPQRLGASGKTGAGSPFNILVSLGSALGLLVLLASGVSAADWPSWGGQPSRNMANETEKGLPDWYSLGNRNENGEIDLSTTKNVKWVARLGTKTCGSPVVSQGKVFIGTAGESFADAALMCFDEKTGKELGKYVCGQHATDSFGVCSTPSVESDRLYFVTPYPAVVCVDLKAWLAAPVTGGSADPARFVVWRYDMAKAMHVMQDHVASCSVLIDGDYLYVCTGNGRYKYTSKPFYPLTPSFIALNKHTGQLVARDDEQIGEQLWRGQWSSPSLATVNGKTQILFATGNGLCYGFEPVDPTAKVIPNRSITTKLRGPIVDYIDVTGKNIAGLSPAQYASKFNLLPLAHDPASPVEFRYSVGLPVATPLGSIPTAQVPDVPILKKIWSFDCLPPEYRNAPFYAHGTKGDGKKHPCDIIATPVFYRNRVYIAIGGDPVHGSKNSRGNLVCIDPTRTGDITTTGKVWNNDKLNAAITTVSIADGLLFVIDEASVIHCLDAATGQLYWSYSLGSDRGQMNSAMVAADGKLFAGRTILAASKSLKVLCVAEGKSNNICSQPCVANGVLFAVHDKWLWAICDKGDKRP